MTFQIVLFMVLMALHSVISMDEIKKNETWRIIRSSNMVSNKVYKILKENNDVNILYCPLSTNVILSLISTGSSGKTAKELKNALDLNIRDEEIKLGFQDLLKELQGSTLQLATRIFPQTGFKLVPEFKTTAVTYFYTDIQTVNYYNPKRAAEIINTFVEKNTNNKIHNIVDASQLDSSTQLVLVNAAHFKDKWNRPFKNTFIDDFHLSKDRKVKTTMMTATDAYHYIELKSLNAKVVLIDFKNPLYSFVIILPHKIGGLHEMERKLATTNFDKIMKNMISTYIQLIIPKFEINDDINLNSVCNKLGIKTLFTNNANLTGFVRNQKISVSEIVQKTYIKVDENGVEAAAATGSFAELLLKSPVKEPRVKFIADHPFLFKIMRGNTIIFQGRLSIM